MDELEAIWRDSFGDHESRRAAAERQAVRWEWTSNRRYDLRPHYFQRHNLPRGKRLAAEPADRGHSYLYGFDGGDRVVLARRFAYGLDYNQNPILMALRGLKAELQHSDEYLSYSEDGVEAVTYSQFEPRKPVAVALLTQEGGRPAGYRSLEVAVGPQIRVHSPEAVWQLASRTRSLNRQWEEYGYDGERLVQVSVRLDHMGGLKQFYTERLTYDGSRLASIDMALPDGTIRPMYRRPGRGQSLPELSQRVERRLLQAIPDSLAAARIRDRAYCLVLSHHDRYAPPSLILGLEKERDELLRRHGAEAHYYLFLPSRPWVEVEDPEFEAEYALFEQQVNQKEGGDLARSMLSRVAAQLARRSWDGVLDVTPQFVVYPADYEMGDVPEAIAVSNPVERVAALRAKGWL